MDGRLVLKLELGPAATQFRLAAERGFDSLEGIRVAPTGGVPGHPDCRPDSTSRAAFPGSLNGGMSSACRFSPK